jgi:hypothetical protein
MVVVSVLIAPHKRQVLEPVVGSVPVEVVDDVALGDRPVGVLPDLAVLELVAIGPAIVPSKKPVAVLLVAPDVAGSLGGSSASLGVVDALIADVPGLAGLSASSAHEPQRFRSSSHAPIIAVGPPTDEDRLRISDPSPLRGSPFQPPTSTPIRHSSIASIRNGPGLRAMTIGSHAGFRLAFDFGKPEA